MEIKILTAFENTKDFLAQVEQGDSEITALWKKLMIDPYWRDLAQWAPFDLSNMKPAPIWNIDALKEQYKRLSCLSIDELHSKFTGITEKLPMHEDSPLLVALYPICDDNKTVKERQNGVVGTCVFGNIIININPLAQDYEEWIPYVFAHEYHHCVWGNHYFSERKGEGITGDFLEYMLNEGQADLFAESLFPHLRPQWNRLPENRSEESLWGKIKPILFSADHQIHSKFMFGDEVEDLPWCIGYVFGRLIVESFMQKNPGVSWMDLINTSARDILQDSRFKL